MAVNLSPVNITFPNSARFVVEFFDEDGALTVPSSGTLTVSYVERANLTTISSDIGLTLTDSFFLGTWSSSGAVIGLASWSVSASGLTSPAATGTIRVINADD